MTKTFDSRELILGILMEVTRQEEYSHIALRQVLDKYQYLEKQERAFITRVTEGTLEWMLTLDYILDQFSKVRVKKMKPVIRNILRMSVYQLKFMDSVPDSAVCNEAVKLAKKKGFGSLSGFVNGVLRNVARGLDKVSYPPKEDLADYLSVRYSMPKWLVEEWLKVYNPETVEAMLAAFLKDRPLSIRVNCNKTTPKELKEKLEDRGFRVTESPYLKEALCLENYDYLGGIPEFKEGLFQVQDVSSMLACVAADPKEGDLCVDACAAPGGKSLFLGELLKGSGQVIARDLTEYKVNLIRENIERMGAKNVETEVLDACVQDENLLGRADVVLADLPCSGLGVLGKKTDLKYRITKEQLQELSELQRKILAVVQAYVKPGGTLLYSTCTVHSGENEENMKWFLSEFPFEAVSLDEVLSEGLHGETTKEGYLQLLPGHHTCDGFFLAKFRRK